MPAFIDLVGKRFGRLLVLGREGVTVNGVHTRIRWACRCDCGNRHVTEGRHLRQGDAKSCGCLQRDAVASGTHCKTHGMHATKEYSSWKAMKSRCTRITDPEYANYGGRGIRVCNRWMHSFEHFFEDMGYRPSPGHSLDRIDNERGYEPDNCRWATPIEQCNNMRRNRLLTLNGRTMSLMQWSRETDIAESALRSRLAKGWTTTEALTLPTDGTKRRKRSLESIHRGTNGAAS